LKRSKRFDHCGGALQNDLVAKDLFTPVFPLDRTDPLFQAVMQGQTYEAARRQMRELFAEFQDVDKSFVREFQTGGFSPRVFELALCAYLKEEGLALDRSQPAPDFVVRGTRPVAIEVTTTNPPQDAPPSEIELFPSDWVAADRAFVFQLGKALRPKLTHRDADARAYWERPHVSGLPFVIAVGAFHDQHAQWFPDALVAHYLYGVRSVANYDDAGILTLTADRITAHESGGRRIPSALFRQPEAKHLAGVLFSNAHTMAMFNRIGTERGYGSANVAMLRFGVKYNPDPNASTPLPFAYVVGDRPPSEQETFAEGLVLFLNPWAQEPLAPQSLPAIVYHELQDDGRVLTTLPRGFHPFASKTMIFENKEAAVFARYQQLVYLGMVPPLHELPIGQPDIT